MRFFFEIVIAFSLLIGGNSYAVIDQVSSIHSMGRELKDLTHEVDVIRRDQINYKIEKDLLEKAYSSNLQTINIVITIVLGVLGVLGYLGIRNIKEIQVDYSAELEKIRALKIQLEFEIEALRSKQKEFEGQVGNLTKINEEQDRRLKVMELIEKISNYISTNEWQWAVKYADIGLELDSENTILLSQKAICHAKQGELAFAIDAVKKFLSIEPENSLQILNLLEFLILSNQVDEFNALYVKYKQIVDSAHDGSLIVYFRALLYVIGGDLGAAKSILNDFASKQADEPKKFLGTWSFDESKLIVSRISGEEEKQLANSMILLFEGVISSSEFLKKISW